VARLAGDDVARSIQLSIEYDPEPPFTSGHPDRAPAAIREQMIERFVARRKPYQAALP
jgi:cyclohexyl-isocyanide hydratase